MFQVINLSQRDFMTECIPIAEAIDYPVEVKQMQNIPCLESLSKIYCLCEVSSKSKMQTNFYPSSTMHGYELIYNNKKLNIDENYLEKKVS
jgi:hypothetical protein